MNALKLACLLGLLSGWAFPVLAQSVWYPGTTETASDGTDESNTTASSSSDMDGMSAAAISEENTDTSTENTQSTSDPSVPLQVTASSDITENATWIDQMEDARDQLAQEILTATGDQQQALLTEFEQQAAAYSATLPTDADFTPPAESPAQLAAEMQTWMQSLSPADAQQFEANLQAQASLLQAAQAPPDEVLELFQQAQDAIVAQSPETNAPAVSSSDTSTDAVLASSNSTADSQALAAWFAQQPAADQAALQPLVQRRQALIAIASLPAEQQAAALQALLAPSSAPDAETSSAPASQLTSGPSSNNSAN